jgi:hypothetical protein
MNTQFFIPKKIKAGFQSRRDTVDKKLAYIVYYDDKGILRKEKSFNRWIDKDIATVDLDNTPTEGFVLNKGIQRSRDYFGSGRSLIRIYDPRGLEFEISIENLMYILMHTDCVRRELSGKFIYGWRNGDLVLLPVDSDIYKTSVKYTTEPAEIGGTYSNGKFIQKKPYPSWISDGDSGWVPPVNHPEIDIENPKNYAWNEDTVSWGEVAIVE